MLTCFVCGDVPEPEEKAVTLQTATMKITVCNDKEARWFLYRQRDILKTVSAEWEKYAKQENTGT